MKKKWVEPRDRRDAAIICSMAACMRSGSYSVGYAVGFSEKAMDLASNAIGSVIMSDHDIGLQRSLFEIQAEAASMLLTKELP